MMQQTQSLHSVADLPGGLREHGASLTCGAATPSPRDYPKHTASQDMARAFNRWPLASGS